MPAGQGLDIGWLKMIKWISVDNTSLIDEYNCEDTVCVTYGVDVGKVWSHDKRIGRFIIYRPVNDITHWIPLPEPPK